MKEATWFRRFARQTGRPITFTLTQQFNNPVHWQEVFKISKQAEEVGEHLRPQSLGRPVGALMGLTARHPFELTPTWKAELANLPLAEQLDRMANQEIRERLIEEARQLSPNAGGLSGFRNMAYTFPLATENGLPDYEPERSRSIAAIAQTEGRSEVEVCYDILREHDGKQLILRTLSNYIAYDHEVVRQMLTDPICTLGLSDAGAHVRSICDGSQPTFMLTHWSRDRMRGPRLPLEFVVKKQTYDTARLYGLHDRGVLKPGFRADVNIIDYDNLKLEMPEIVDDLPAGGSRFMQKAQGYEYTIVNGQVTIERGNMTGAKPGRLIRGEQHLTYIYRQAAQQAQVIEV
jgi:N-acyl-D-aspartate/D-glutamate deacylase